MTFDVTAPEAFLLGVEEGKKLLKSKMLEEIENAKKEAYRKGYDTGYKKRARLENYLASDLYKRDLHIYHRINQGETVRSVANDYAITPERVEQICTKIRGIKKWES